MKTSEQNLRDALDDSMAAQRYTGELSPRPQRRDERTATMPQETRTDWEIEQLHKQLDGLQRELDDLKKDRDKALLWGVMVLGGAVLGMGSWIFNLIAGKH